MGVNYKPWHMLNLVRLFFERKNTSYFLIVSYLFLDKYSLMS